MNEKLELLVNEVRRRVDSLFPGYGLGEGNTKHTNLYKEYGYPKDPAFDDFYQQYDRNGFASGAINETVRKTWQTYPFLLEATKDDKPHSETTAEEALREGLERLQFWTKLKDADRKSMVGKYAGVIFRFRDGKRMREPVENVGGIDNIVEIIPVYEKQLTVEEWDQDEMSDTYGQPTMYQFVENALPGTDETQVRQFSVHPDRVHIWSEDMSVHGQSALRPGYNALLDLEKVGGAGAEGFWKNAKNAPVLNLDKEAKLEALARMLGAAKESDVPDKMEAVMRDWRDNYDASLMFQGIEAKTLPSTLPSDPEKFTTSPLMVFACSFGIPMKILLGTQTGERASTEDSAKWDAINDARREQHVVPNIMAIVRKLVEHQALPAITAKWRVDWTPLSEATPSEKMERSAKMAEINKSNAGRGEVFTADEMREVVGYEPNSDLDEDDPDAEPNPAQTPKEPSGADGEDSKGEDAAQQ